MLNCGKLQASMALSLVRECPSPRFPQSPYILPHTTSCLPCLSLPFCHSAFTLQPYTKPIEVSRKFSIEVLSFSALKHCSGMIHFPLYASICYGLYIVNSLCQGLSLLYTPWVQYPLQWGLTWLWPLNAKFKIPKFQTSTAASIEAPVLQWRPEARNWAFVF